MAKQTIEINPADLPKERDWNRVALIARKKGAHTNRKKKAAKENCRRKVKDNE